MSVKVGADQKAFRQSPVRTQPNASAPPKKTVEPSGVGAGVFLGKVDSGTEREVYVCSRGSREK